MKFLAAVLISALVMFNHITKAQTVYSNDFASSIADVSPSSPAISINNSDHLVVNASDVGAGYENIDVTFSTINISSNPIVKISVATDTDVDLRIDLVDVDGYSTNAASISKSVTSNNYTVFEYDFRGNFNQSWPTNEVVDASKIEKLVIFFNAGGPGFTGKVRINNLIIGDENGTSASLVKFFVNQVGYDTYGSKKALCSNCEVGSAFTIVDANQNVEFTGTVTTGSQVTGWGNTTWNVIDFSTLQTTGTFMVKSDGKNSPAFEIQDNALFDLSANGPITFFNGMRSVNSADYNLSFNGSRNDQVNVFGGWWDANGDPGKHMSHLSFANHFSPQQIPMVVWWMLKAQKISDFGANSNAVDSEIDWGLDYLIRNVDSDGYLYLAIFDDWGNNEASREICEWGAAGGNDSERSSNYQAAMREGAGVAIAALAFASKEGYSNSAQALSKAEQLYAHLKSAGDGYATKNLEYCNDHTENIIDIYCGLLATTELYKATNDTEYKTDAIAYVNRLLALQGSNGEVYSDENTKNRPFYHAADEGLPIVALSEFLTIDTSLETEIATFASNWITWFTTISYEVNNPFEYVRQYNKASVDGNLQAAKKSFFLPHSNETDYWWQGENARLASMATALLTAQKIVDDSFLYGNNATSALAVAQLDWILGKNPFGRCMMFGYGEENYPTYLNGVGNKKVNQIGGICNGITSDITNEEAPTFMPYDITDWQNWRWIEQWLPHDAWYLLAVSKIDELNPVNNEDCAGIPGGSAAYDKCGVCSGGSTGIPVDECLITGFTDLIKNSLRVYPNPVNSTCSISGEFTAWKLCNMMGQQLTTGSSFTIEMADLDKGVYLLVVDGQTLKVIKK